MRFRRAWRLMSRTSGSAQRINARLRWS